VCRHSVSNIRGWVRYDDGRADRCESSRGRLYDLRVSHRDIHGVDSANAAVQYAVTRGSLAFSLFVSFWASRRAVPAGICDKGV
jgi:hypothetical protein